MQHENRAIFSLARHLGKRRIGKAIPNGIAALLYGTEPFFKAVFRCEASSAGFPTGRSRSEYLLLCTQSTHYENRKNWHA